MKFVKVTNNEAGDTESIVNVDEISHVQKYTEQEDIGPNEVNFEVHEIYLRHNGIIEIDKKSYDTLENELLGE